MENRETTIKMSIYEFLERLEADPFDPELDALFLGAEPADRPEE